jgi:hypothetical protein
MIRQLLKLFVTAQKIALISSLAATLCYGATDSTLRVLMLPDFVKTAGEGEIALERLKKICEIVGNSFTNKNSSNPFMPFSSTTCYNNTEKLVGQSVSSPWTIAVNVDQDEIVLRLIFDPAGADLAAIVSAAKSATEPWEEIRIKGGKYAAGLVSYLVDSLPFAYRITPDHISPDGKKIILTQEATSKEKSKLNRLPNTLVIYTLKYDQFDPVFRAHKLGVGIRTKNGISQNQWNYRGETLPKTMETAIWAHNAAGRKALQSKILPRIQKRVSHLARTAESQGGIDAFKQFNALAAAFTNNIAAGYTGIRYGVPLLRSDALSNKSAFIGVAAQFRSGILEGVKVFADIWPHVKATIKDTEAELGGKRILAGWSFRYNLELLNVPITAVSITPQLGIWNFALKVPVSDPSGEFRSQNFSIKNAPSLAVELAAELAKDWYLIQPFIAKSAGLRGSAEVSMLRVGADAVIAPKSWTVLGGHYSLLTFAFLESTDFPRSAAEKTSEDNTIQSIRYTQAYSGIGVAYSW